MFVIIICNKHQHTIILRQARVLSKKLKINDSNYKVFYSVDQAGGCECEEAYGYVVGWEV